MKARAARFFYWSLLWAVYWLGQVVRWTLLAAFVYCAWRGIALVGRGTLAGVIGGMILAGASGWAGYASFFATRIFLYELLVVLDRQRRDEISAQLNRMTP